MVFFVREIQYANELYAFKQNYLTNTDVEGVGNGFVAWILGFTSQPTWLVGNSTAPLVFLLVIFLAFGYYWGKKR